MNQIVGFRFVPKDEELIFHYLLNKIQNNSFNGYGIIADADVFERNPEDLHDLASYWPDDGSLYFFAQRTRRYKNGKRPRRTQTNGQGTWKATQSNQEIKYAGEHIGDRKLLVYHVNKVKTHWRMHEYTLRLPSSSSGGEYLDVVLCRVFIIDKKEDEVVNKRDEVMVPVVQQVQPLNCSVPIFETCSVPCTSSDNVSSTMVESVVEDVRHWENLLDMETIDQLLNEPSFEVDSHFQ
ncbi:hypothetical protein ACHQM5_030069 [Ranunculus cassubicifolius]